MAKRPSVKNHQRSNGNLNRFVTPELRQQIILLKRELNDCEGCLSDHLYVMNEIQEALTIAQECAQCLLTSDPFTACEKLMKQKEEADDAIINNLEELDHIDELEDTSRVSVRENKQAKRIEEVEDTAPKLVTSGMRQGIVELKGQLGEYAACLRGAFDHMLELDCLNRAVELANALKCVDQLESLEARKRREYEAEEEEEVGDL